MAASNTDLDELLDGEKSAASSLCNSAAYIIPFPISAAHAMLQERLTTSETSPLEQRSPRAQPPPLLRECPRFLSQPCAFDLTGVILCTLAARCCSIKHVWPCRRADSSGASGGGGTSGSAAAVSPGAAGLKFDPLGKAPAKGGSPGKGPMLPPRPPQRGKDTAAAGGTQQQAGGQKQARAAGIAGARFFFRAWRVTLSFEPAFAVHLPHEFTAAFRSVLHCV